MRPRTAIGLAIGLHVSFAAACSGVVIARSQSQVAWFGYPWSNPDLWATYGTTTTGVSLVVMYLPLGTSRIWLRFAGSLCALVVSTAWTAWIEHAFWGEILCSYFVLPYALLSVCLFFAVRLAGRRFVWQSETTNENVPHAHSARFQFSLMDIFLATTAMAPLAWLLGADSDTVCRVFSMYFLLIHPAIVCPLTLMLAMLLLARTISAFRVGIVVAMIAALATMGAAKSVAFGEERFSEICAVVAVLSIVHGTLCTSSFIILRRAGLRITRKSDIHGDGKGKGAELFSGQIK